MPNKLGRLGLFSVVPAAPNKPCELVPVEAGCPPKLNPVVFAPEVPVFPKRPSPVAGLFVVPKSDWPLAPPEDDGGLKLNDILENGGER